MTCIRLVIALLLLLLLTMNDLRPWLSVKTSQMMEFSEYFNVLKTMPLVLTKAITVVLLRIPSPQSGDLNQIFFWSLPARAVCSRSKVRGFGQEVPGV